VLRCEVCLQPYRVRVEESKSRAEWGESERGREEGGEQREREWVQGSIAGPALGALCYYVL